MKKTQQNSSHHNEQSLKQRSDSKAVEPQSMTKGVSLVPFIIVLALALLPLSLSLPTADCTLAGAGALLGWLGSGLLSVSLLLMVREPIIAQWFGGLERMYCWHHLLGTYGYLALLVHPLLLAGSVFPANPHAAWHQLSPAAQNWTVLLGWLALLGLMLGLAGTLALRLRYSVWRLLHATLGMSVTLGITHIVAIGGLSIPAWLVIAPTALALSWRMLRTDFGGGARPYEVSAVSTIAERIIETRLRPLADAIQVTPGQFVMAAFFEGPRFHGCGEFHPYTVTGIAADGSLFLSIKALGDCTRNIQSLEAGVAARIQGPFGTFLLQRKPAPELWIAGGIGITPFVALLRSAQVTSPTEFIYIYREQTSAPHLPELVKFATDQKLLHFHPLAVQENLEQLFALLAVIGDLKEHHAYLCGPPGLVDAIIPYLRQQGIPLHHIHDEHFDFR